MGEGSSGGGDESGGGLMGGQAGSTSPSGQGDAPTSSAVVQLADDLRANVVKVSDLTATQKQAVADFLHERVDRKAAAEQDITDAKELVSDGFGDYAIGQAIAGLQVVKGTGDVVCGAAELAAPGNGPCQSWKYSTGVGSVIGKGIAGDATGAGVSAIKTGSKAVTDATKATDQFLEGYGEYRELVSGEPIPKTSTDGSKAVSAGASLYGAWSNLKKGEYSRAASDLMSAAGQLPGTIGRWFGAGGQVVGGGKDIQEGLGRIGSGADEQVAREMRANSVLDDMDRRIQHLRDSRGEDQRLLDQLENSVPPGPSGPERVQPAAGDALPPQSSAAPTDSRLADTSPPSSQGTTQPTGPASPQQKPNLVQSAKASLEQLSPTQQWAVDKYLKEQGLDLASHTTKVGGGDIGFLKRAEDGSVKGTLVEMFDDGDIRITEWQQTKSSDSWSNEKGSNPGGGGDAEEGKPKLEVALDGKYGEQSTARKLTAGGANVKSEGGSLGVKPSASLGVSKKVTGEVLEMRQRAIHADGSETYVGMRTTDYQGEFKLEASMESLKNQSIGASAGVAGPGYTVEFGRLSAATVSDTGELYRNHYAFEGSVGTGARAAAGFDRNKKGIVVANLSAYAGVGAGISPKVGVEQIDGFTDPRIREAAIRAAQRETYLESYFRRLTRAPSAAIDAAMNGFKRAPEGTAEFLRSVRGMDLMGSGPP